MVKTHVEGNNWCVSVIDAGAGIDKEKQAQIFTPFFTGKSNGTGLGLAVVQTVLRAHHGSIDWESEPGKGSRFTLSIPVHCFNEQPVSEVRYG